MELEMVRSALGWCTVINYALLLYWFGVFVLAHDWLHGMHSRWFSLSAEQFDAIHYASMAFFKLCIFLFNLAPYIALHIAA